MKTKKNEPRICKRGHEVVGRHCRECKKITDALSYAKNIDKRREKTRLWLQRTVAAAQWRMCKRGHQTIGPCMECRALTWPMWREKNIERVRANALARTKAYQARNRQLTRDRRKAWRAANPEKDREMARKYHEQNKEKQHAANRAWAKANPKRVLARSRARKAYIRQRTPAWADLKRIKEIYLNCPPGHHVDHIVPLRGKTVSGLHVETNLQYLPAVENQRKKNRFVELT